MYPTHLDLPAFNALLKTRQIGRASVGNEVWTEIDSTNTRAIALARSGAPHGVIVAARQQTAGRGRQGKIWQSPPDSGLYISFLLRPDIALTELPLISLATGAAVATAIRTVAGIDVGLKWVNDIVSDGRKLGGILAEMPDRTALVIGIGINLRTINMIKESDLPQTAITLEELLGAPTDVNILAAEIANQVERVYTHLCAGDRISIIKEWKKYTVTLGKQIKATCKDEIVEGVATDISTDGSLVVDTAEGQRLLHAGEISVRSASGSYY